MVLNDAGGFANYEISNLAYAPYGRPPVQAGIVQVVYRWFYCYRGLEPMQRSKVKSTVNQEEPKPYCKAPRGELKTRCP